MIESIINTIVDGSSSTYGAICYVAKFLSHHLPTTHQARSQLDDVFFKIWRHETYMFHLCVNRMTSTLHNVVVILSMSIDG
jgi:hypothetical protein